MPYGENTSAEVELVGAAVVDAALKVHRALGPGLLESVYVLCLAHELRSRRFQVEREVPVPVVFEGLTMETGFRIDLLVNGLVIVEAKSVLEMHPVYPLQCKTHLRLADKRLGFLINFNVPFLKDGLRRIVN